MTVQYKCPGCNKIVAKEDRRRRLSLVVVSPATMIQTHQQAPRIRCECGKAIVLLKGST